MTTNSSITEGDEAARSLTADCRETNAGGAQTSLGYPQDPPVAAPRGDGLDELEELLKKLDSPELISIRRLFNMC